MTYREKLQKEHPERVNDKCLGGCEQCPYSYGYTENAKRNKACFGFSETGQYLGVSDKVCTECWDRVIPGTEKDKYKNLTRDELIEIINHLEHTIELEDKEIQHRGKLLNEKDQKIAKLECACGDKNTDTEIVRLRKECDECHMTIGQLEQQIDKNLEVYFDRIKEKDKKIEYLKRDIAVRDEVIAALKKELRKSEATINWYRTLRDEKETEIAILKDRLEFKKAVISVSNDTIEKLECQLKEEKREHAKHHGIFGRFYHD